MVNHDLDLTGLENIELRAKKPSIRDSRADKCSVVALPFHLCPLRPDRRETP
jgi:hypothetical protein